MNKVKQQETKTVTKNTKIKSTRKPPMKVGDTFKNKHGEEFEVVEYHHSKKVIVEFTDGNKGRVSTQTTHIKSGSVRNPNTPSYYGRGFTGNGKHPTNVNGKKTKAYQSWLSMLSRCYSEVHNEGSPSYKECEVDKRWWNFQTFAEWYNSIPNSETYHLDKDLLKPDNKVYSPETCVLLPVELNNIGLNEKSKKTDLPMGVNEIKSEDGSASKFVAVIYRGGKAEYLGRFDTAEEASEVYKKEKEEYVQERALEFKDKIAPEAFEALMNWKVPAIKQRQKSTKVSKGDIRKNNQGYDFEVTKVEGSLRVSVKFLDSHGAGKIVRASEVRSGTVSNPYHPTVCNKGFIGEGFYNAYKPKKGGVTPAYSAWKAMLSRCYTKDGQSINGLKVCKEWLNFQNFASWYHQQFYRKDTHHIDRDIKTGITKVYSPRTTTLIPKGLGNLIQKSPRKTDSHLPTGVSKSGDKFRAQMTIENKSHYIGTFASSGDAEQAYLLEKQKYVRLTAEKYKDQLDPIVYERLTSGNIKDIL